MELLIVSSQTLYHRLILAFRDTKRVAVNELPRCHVDSAETDKVTLGQGTS
jgi:hypothetical protein